MIYKASHHPVIYPFFKLYALWKIKFNFSRVVVNGNFRDRNLPVLIISNHISWWDGFWTEYLNKTIFHRKLYFMMLEEQLKQHMFFNKTGGYSVRKGTRSIIESLEYTAGLLRTHNNIVLMFPQGKIESLYKTHLNFEKGIEYVLRKVKNEIHIIFQVNLIDYFSKPKPGLYIYFTEYGGSDFTTSGLENEYRKFHSSSITENREKA